MHSQIIKTIESNIHHFGFSNLVDFAANQAKMFTLSKIEEYRNITRYFEDKYKMSYRKFEAIINKSKKNENFDKEDDLMEWRFAEESVMLYKKELKSLQKC
ncbi:MAG: hypothetical protein A2275_16145 [Bacteroidetes bacterium RIFOXYA12_FULL_35_11]|nr:MAG: hypothetical protein A2X01_05315 [Bacteroidetes bacterium GWF2_35_48]OFY75907.1 MAG: hypothetical protein A2275_16145 [Bacteroidetes bacterium RIFOXYA12_FULL_35_11]HBX52173.1 hypothetical protein [Bacteroidales bacterium]